MDEHLFKCQICGNSTDNTKYTVKEMMLGLREEFIYFLCNRCRCLQIEEIPKNIGKYYAYDKYYSFSPQRNRKLVSILTKPSFYQKGILYKILRHYLILDNALLSIGKLNLPRKSRILDVGSGYGDLLIKLKKLGYSNLIGIDPFIDHDIDHNDHNVKIRKVPIDKLDKKEGFDLIMFHHSFEHVPNPLEVLLYAKKHLKKKGSY
jgi:2-polyprenyl-3-methyl-5-hydroxy-6-metoxy-1,4-benzoquinol methylase